jgi:hypothetical protein
LMPAKLVREEFRRRFHTTQFCITEDALFSFSTKDEQALRRYRNDRTAIARILASAERFGSVRFISLADLFQVSTQAMAIRLAELELAA